MESKKKLIYVTTTVAILIGIIFFVSKKAYQRKDIKDFFSTEQGVKSENDGSSLNISNNTSVENIGDNSLESDPVNDNSNSETSYDTSADSPADITENSYLDLADSDCKNNCSEFNDSDDVRYCKEYCELEDEKQIAENCDDLGDLDQDYCFKHQAFNKKDLSICEVIVDENIKQSCKKQKI